MCHAGHERQGGFNTVQVRPSCHGSWHHQCMDGELEASQDYHAGILVKDLTSLLINLRDYKF